VIVIGVGGVGQYMVQVAKAMGAGTVIAVDIVDARLEKMLSYGADAVINASGKGPKEVSAEVKALRKERGLPAFGWKIFEATGSKPGQETALALLSFRRHGVKWAILETGMGGRLDATNVVTPELCLLTSIALDHAAHLGNDLAAIAAEKAGILKPGVPVISVPQPAAAEQVIAHRAAAVGAPLLQLGRDFCWTNTAAGGTLTGSGYCITGIRPGLPGGHQQQNLALAGAAAAWLGDRGEALSGAAIKQGLEQVRWPGRLEWLPGRILLDGAHNQAGAKTLAAYLQAENLAPVHLIVGCKADKDYAALLSVLLPCCGRVYAVPAPVDAAVSTEKLVQLALRAGLHATAYDRPATALAAAQEERGPEETLVVAGSLFLVAALREQLVESESVDICA
jgi:dihydrofolate synthase/folylpolyglutamate synthase